MTFRTRVILLIIGIIIFATAAPVLLFLAQGYRYDFENRRVVKTGTISVKTEPRGAEVFLDGKLIGKAPRTKRFLLPGEYEIIVKNDGYRSWTKRALVHETMVTYLPPNKEKIILFHETPGREEIATSAPAALISDGFVFFDPAKDRIAVRRFAAQDTFTLLETNFTPEIDTQIISAAAGPEQASGQLLLNDSGQIVLLNGSGRFSIPAAIQNPAFSADESILGIAGGNLVKYTAANGTELLRQDVLAFTVGNGNIYYLTSSDTPELFQLLPNQADPLLFGNIPKVSSKAEIIVLADRQIMLLLDKSLYLISSELKKLGDNITYAIPNRELEGAFYGNDREIWLYSENGQNQNRLITRSSQKLGQPHYNQEINYLFISEGGAIKGIELDFSGQPNIYTFAEGLENPRILGTDRRGKTLYYQDGSSVIRLQIR